MIWKEYNTIQYGIEGNEGERKSGFFKETVRHLERVTISCHESDDGSRMNGETMESEMKRKNEICSLIPVAKRNRKSIKETFHGKKKRLRLCPTS